MHKINSKVDDIGTTFIEGTYYEDQFHGPFCDYIERIHGNKSYISIRRIYAEDAKYADKTYLQMAVQLIEETLQDREEVFLKVWKMEVDFKKEDDVLAKLSKYILDNVKF